MILAIQDKLRFYFWLLSSVIDPELQTTLHMFTCNARFALHCNGTLISQMELPKIMITVIMTIAPEWCQYLMHLFRIDSQFILGRHPKGTDKQIFTGRGERLKGYMSNSYSTNLDHHISHRVIIKALQVQLQHRWEALKECVSPGVLHK